MSEPSSCIWTGTGHLLYSVLSPDDERGLDSIPSMLSPQAAAALRSDIGGYLEDGREELFRLLYEQPDRGMYVYHSPPNAISWGFEAFRRKHIGRPLRFIMVTDQEITFKVRGRGDMPSLPLTLNASAGDGSLPTGQAEQRASPLPPEPFAPVRWKTNGPPTSWACKTIPNAAIITQGLTGMQKMPQDGEIVTVNGNPLSRRFPGRVSWLVLREGGQPGEPSGSGADASVPGERSFGIYLVELKKNDTGNTTEQKEKIVSVRSVDPDEDNDGPFLPEDQHATVAASGPAIHDRSLSSIPFAVRKGPSLRAPILSERIQQHFRDILRRKDWDIIGILRSRMLAGFTALIVDNVPSKGTTQIRRGLMKQRQAPREDTLRAGRTRASGVMGTSSSASTDASSIAPSIPTVSAASRLSSEEEKTGGTQVGIAIPQKRRRPLRTHVSSTSPRDVSSFHPTGLSFQPLTVLSTVSESLVARPEEGGSVSSSLFPGALLEGLGVQDAPTVFGKVLPIEGEISTFHSSNRSEADPSPSSHDSSTNSAQQAAKSGKRARYLGSEHQLTAIPSRSEFTEADSYDSPSGYILSGPRFSDFASNPTKYEFLNRLAESPSRSPARGDQQKGIGTKLPRKLSTSSVLSDIWERPAASGANGATSPVPSAPLAADPTISSVPVHPADSSNQSMRIGFDSLMLFSYGSNSSSMPNLIDRQESESTMFIDTGMVRQKATAASCVDGDVGPVDYQSGASHSLLLISPANSDSSTDSILQPIS